MKRPLLLLLCAFLCASFAFSQSKIPVVSGLKAEADGTAVRLSWTPPAEEAAGYIIYRSAEPLSRQTLDRAVKIVTLPGTALGYTDTLGDTKEYYYAVLVTFPDGTTADSLIPSFNTTLAPVSASELPQPPEPAVISRFTAIVKDETVIITYTSTPRNRNLVLYRSTSPFTDMASLTSAVIVETFADKGTPYIDYPIPEVAYYYALTDEETVRAGTVAFKPGINTTEFPVSVSTSAKKFTAQDIQTIRPIPLPYLNLSGSIEDRSGSLSEETMRIIEKLTAETEQLTTEFLEPYIFPVDRLSESGGEEYMLRSILQNTLEKGSWEAAIHELGDFLSIRRTEETTARANFYLGEAYYFTGRYEEALFKFLLSQDIYNTQSRKWIQDILSRLSGT